MNIADQIADILKKNPGGLKASEIAAKIGCTRTKVNSYLYSHQEQYEQHSGYVWKMKTIQANKPTATPQVKETNGTNVVGVTVDQRVGGNLVSTVTIIPNNNGYNISSTNNQIACCDCQRFFSIHANACPFCGCPLHYVADTYFKRFSVDATPPTSQYSQYHEQSDPKPVQKVSPCNKEEKKKKCDLLTSIRAKSNYYIGRNIDIETTSLEVLTNIYQKTIKRKELVDAIPLSATLFIQGYGIDLYMLSTPTLETVLERCTKYLEHEATSGIVLEEQANTLFREVILSRINCDEQAIVRLRTLYDKYAKSYKGDKESYLITIVDINNIKHQIDVTFFGTLRSYFRRKSKELFEEAFPWHTHLEDPVKGFFFMAYSYLANTSVGPSFAKEITLHKDKMLSSEAASNLLCDLDFGKRLIYRSVEISSNDTIVEAEDFSHEHTSELVFLHVGIHDEPDHFITKWILGIYCKVCKKYYITHSVFLELVTKGKVNAKLLTAELAEFDYDDDSIFSSFSPESLLRKCGYTVNANDSLPDEKRQRILKTVIDNRLYSPDGIVSHLSFLISMSKKVETRNMKYAIQKWTRDIDYIKRTFIRRQANAD